MGPAPSAASMSTLHGPFEGYFVGLPSPSVDALGVSRFHDLQLDWGTLRPGRLVDAPPESPADPTPVHWPVLGPILAELEDGQWYRLWLHDARLHWSRPRLARDDGERSLWCVRGHLVGRLAAGPVAEPRRFAATWVEPARVYASPSGCAVPLLLLLALAVALPFLRWPWLLLALLAAALAWRYPHGWPLFVALAAATGFHRVITSAHYPSDVACGAAIGLIAAACCLGGPRLPRPNVAPGGTA